MVCDSGLAFELSSWANELTLARGDVKLQASVLQRLYREDTFGMADRVAAWLTQEAYLL